MNIKKLLMASIAFLVISQILNQVFVFLTMKYYVDPTYFGVWSKVMMPGAGPPPMSFYIWGIVLSFIIAAIFVYFYEKFEMCIPGKGYRKGINYGAMLFLLVTVPSIFGMFLLINLPAALIFWWAIGDLVTYLLGGMAIAKIYG